MELFDRCKIGGWTNEEVADLVEKELSETGSVLVIANTKKISGRPLSASSK